MAKREISSTLKNLKFMQRAALKEEKKKIEEEPDRSFPSLGTIKKKCVVIMEGDPQPGALVGRMSFQSFNPSIDKLNEEALNDRKTDSTVTTSGSNGGRMSFSQNTSSLNEPAGLKAEPSQEANGDLKRKQSETVPEQQHPKKSPRNLQSGQESSPSNRRSSGFKRPKGGKVDWSVLKPPKPQN
ncbi:PREDICTED: uncharacterized protein LOC104810769 [Tarenaya hassleriana]|uniref:uncharacterized protein LOC104810769 n=1 Tax=Tarenaya hassleriana TaxID=28532 RepID=UPI00053C40B8|nr:PREDICTED: uncharacterized protein LOC104810769 [Tarenaya hassleriana]